ncbi:hypothetical protein CDD80_6633 [Ophiocordyceps camponoti-rufipedis]|uniref:AAA+ ATPase domain-containing protein n=1 Tax=Ophiocordyceps camponoti-rufipedis TaxID=2004952 RepID=A0A2C5ZHB1_9HYPO|nr:hypothetical protein CDD80_6633 [Ophiocordyceps camponoti-rufipedis]
MLSSSSPITFPTSSPPPVTRPPQQENRPPKRRVQGPFILEDSGSEAETDDPALFHRAKRRMLHAAGEQETPPETAERNEECIQSQQEVPATQPEGFPSPVPETLPSASAHPDSLFSGLISDVALSASYRFNTCRGQAFTIKERRTHVAPSYESMVAARSRTKEGRAIRSYYGIEMNELLSQVFIDSWQQKQPLPPGATDYNGRGHAAENTIATAGQKPQPALLWTEKYRARAFDDLCGDDGTNRKVLRWLKKWDPLVFNRTSQSTFRRPWGKFHAEEKPHRKILMLTGPPGLGKTTLAHVCASHAGYEVMEINASDDRSRNVVKDRIRTSLGTQSVKTVVNASSARAPSEPARPLCVVVDEVDGVTSGSGASGEGGFVKALMDLIQVDERNASASLFTAEGSRKKQKGDDFRQMRPLILICNDVYHPSLRPLRQSNLAEIIYVGRPSLEAVVSRLTMVFEEEGVACEKDAVRKLCEAVWGVSSGPNAKRDVESPVDGDIRGIMVVGEWVAGRFRSTTNRAERPVMTRDWIEDNVLEDLANGAGGARALGSSSVRDIVSRLFQEGAGFPQPNVDKAKSWATQENPQIEHAVSEQLKKQATERLSAMVNASGDISSIVTDMFTEYADRDYNDDCYLTKPNQGYDWLYFHDACQSRLYTSQEWELAPYLSQPVLAYHHLFASPRRYLGPAKADDSRPPVPFSGPRADYQAREAERQNRAQLQALHGQLTPWLMRAFRSADDLACDFLPYLVRMLSPEVNPVVISGSQGPIVSVRREDDKTRLRRASEILADTGIALQKGRIESESFAGREAPDYVYRMDPDVDALAFFETSTSTHTPTRFAVRQALDQELQRTLAARSASARQARFLAGDTSASCAAAPPPEAAILEAKTETAPMTVVRTDFFGRVSVEPLKPVIEAPREDTWLAFSEGFSLAVQRPVSVEDLMRML